MKRTKKNIACLMMLALTITPFKAVYAEQNITDLQDFLKDIGDQKKQKELDIQNLREQSGSILSAIEASKAKAQDNQLTLAEVSAQLALYEDLVDSLEREKQLIVRNMYIAHNQSNPFLQIIMAGDLAEAFEKQVYLHHLHAGSRDKLHAQSILLKQVRSEQVAALAEREIILASIDTAQGELAQLKGVITETEQTIKDLEKNSREVEAQILALQVPETPKNTSNPIVASSATQTGADTIDFSKKSELTIVGSGTPHGLGMSQYGAKAMADAGSSFTDILTHYYQGTKIKKADTSSTVMRVKLSASSTGGTLVVRAGQYQNTATGETHGPGAIIAASAGLTLVPLGEDSRITVSYKKDRFNTFRGGIRIIGSPGALTTINTLPLEDYLRSVISGEMSSSWPLEALKAQAVAARNYAYKNKKPGSEYDICDTPSCQVYLGSNHEFASTDQAVHETKNTLLVYGDEIITAYYFSSSGGWTENNENVWGGNPIPWLRGVPSPNEQSPYNSWRVVTLNKNTVQAYLNSDTDTSVGELQRIDIIKRGVSGRVMAVKITGSSGEKTVTGKTFKYVINVNLPDGTQDYIKSSLFGFE